MMVTASTERTTSNFWNMVLKQSFKTRLNLHASQTQPIMNPRDDKKEKPGMPSFNHNVRLGAQLGRVDDQETSEHFASLVLHENAPVIGNALNRPFWSSGPNSPESICEVSDLAPSLPSHSYSSGRVHSRWRTDQRLARVITPGRMTAIPERTVHESGAAFAMGAEAAFPVSNTVFPATTNFHSSGQGPFLGWAQLPGPLFPPPASWPSSSSTASQHLNHNAPSGAFRTTSVMPPPQPAITNTGPEDKPMPTGFPSSSSITGAVQKPTGAYPIPVIPTTRRTRGERWASTSFRCMWRSSGSPCRAQIAGNRTSVMNHLRDEHNFTCDNQKEACLWDQCDACMQRRNIPRHIIACHLAVKVNCPDCGLSLSRKDAEKKHRQACAALKPTTSG